MGANQDQEGIRAGGLPSLATRPGLFPTLPTAARLVGVPSPVLRRASARGELATYQLGGRWRRVYLPELFDWVRSHRVTPVGDRGGGP